MEERLRAHMDQLFAGVQPTRASVELKEEMLQNTIDKYHDLLSEGKSPEAAYNIAVAGIGDVSELIGQLQMEQSQYVPFNQQEVDEAGRRSVLFRTVAIALYILCPVPVILFGNKFGVVLLFVFVATATCLLIYNKMSKPYYRTKGRSVVEEFQIWQSKNSDKRKLYDAVHGAMWMVVLVLYFAISFLTGAWGISWLIFVIGAAVDQILRAIFDLMEEKERNNGGYGR